MERMCEAAGKRVCGPFINHLLVAVCAIQLHLQIRIPIARQGHAVVLDENYNPLPAHHYTIPPFNKCSTETGHIVVGGIIFTGKSCSPGFPNVCV